MDIQIFQEWSHSDQCLLGPNIQNIVELPIDLPDLKLKIKSLIYPSCRVEEALEHILQDGSRAQADPEPFDCLRYGIYDVRRNFEDVGPNEVQQMG